MADNKITVHQAFYGEVNRAHSCIKQTLSDPELTSFLIVFTDRPAALPPGVSLLPYISGGSFSKYYFFTKTFPDTTATRAGMVFTHVLILNLEDAIAVNNLQDVMSHFTQSVESKSDVIEEFQIIISNTDHTLLKSQPKYIQQTIAAYLSGATPVLFSGDITTFSNALQQIWNSPNTVSRKKIKFRASFTLSDIETVRDLTIVSIQKDFLPKWQGHAVIHGDNHDQVEIDSPSQALFLGHKDENPFYHFLVELNVDFSEVQSYGQYEKIYTHYLSIGDIEDANILRQDIRTFAKISPAAHDGRAVKKSFLDRLSALIQQEKDSNVKALRNIDWSSLPDGEERGEKIVSSFIVSEIESPNQQQLINLSELVILSTSDIEQNWWHKTVRESLRNTFKKRSEASLRNIWRLIEFSESTAESVLSVIEHIQDCESALRKSIPENLRTETSTSLVRFAHKRNWLLFNADVLLREFTIEVSVEMQLELEKKLPLSDSVGVKYLAAKLTPNRLIDLAVKTGNKKLIDLSVGEIEENVTLLKGIDLSVACWLDIWMALVIKTKKVFFGLAGREKEIVSAVIDLLVTGKAVDNSIIALISESPFSDLSDYGNRSEAWKVINATHKEKFLATTTAGVLKKLVSGQAAAKSIESDISDRLTSDSFMTAFLNETRNDMEPVIVVFSGFKILKDALLAGYIGRFRGHISETQAKKLGMLVIDNTLSKSARAIYERAKYDSSFSPAYEICRELVSFTWWESITNFGSHQPKRRPRLTVSVLSREDSARANLPTVVILTAIKEEYNAVREHLKEPVDADQNDTAYEAGLFEINGREIAKVIIRECGAKNTTAAQETERAIQYFKPSMILFVGIAGSRKPKDFGIGDVIFPEKVYSYEGGKSERDSFLSRPDNAFMSYSLLEIAKKERKKEDWKILIKGDWNQEVKADIGVIASGEQVVEHYHSGIGEILHDHFNDTSAVEMEGFGFGKAANRQGRETSSVLIGVVRGISDIIEQPDKKKKKSNNDRRPSNAKQIASDTAAAFAFWLILKIYE